MTSRAQNGQDVPGVPPEACRVGGELLRRYVGGHLGGAAAGALEVHLAGCALCQTSVANHESARSVSFDRHEATWARIRMDTEPIGGLPERVLLRLRVPPHIATLVAAAPPLRAAWLVVLTGTLGLAVLASHAGDGRLGMLAFLLLAPIAPALGIALAYGAASEPVGEVASVAPYPAFKVVLLRALTVVLAASAPAILLSVLLPGPFGSFGVLLLPAVAATAVTLALASWVPAAGAGAVTMVAWLAVAAPSLQGTRRLAPVDMVAGMPVFGSAAQLVYLAVAVSAAVVVAQRRDSMSGSLRGGTA